MKHLTYLYFKYFNTSGVEILVSEKTTVMPDGMIKAYYEEGISCHIYVKDNRKHREDGPAEILFNSDGIINEETWFLEGVLIERICYQKKGWRIF